MKELEFTIVEYIVNNMKELEFTNCKYYERTGVYYNRIHCK